MGKVLKAIGILWGGLGLLSILGMIAIEFRRPMDAETSGMVGAGVGMAVVFTFFVFIMPGAWLAYKGHRLIQNDAKVTLRTADVAMQMEDRSDREVIAEQQNARRALPRVERACPFCAEPILVQAKVCKHCGRDLPQPTLDIR